MSIWAILSQLGEQSRFPSSEIGFKRVASALLLYYGLGLTLAAALFLAELIYRKHECGMKRHLPNLIE